MNNPNCEGRKPRYISNQRRVRLFIITDVEWSINLDHCHKIITIEDRPGNVVYVTFYVKGDAFEIPFDSQHEAETYLRDLFSALEAGQRVFDYFSKS